MDSNFWLGRWENGEIGFHADEVNVHLKKYLPDFELNEGSRVFIPLCGKTRDIGWLQAQGYKVVGIELSEIAVKNLFEELQLEPTVDFVGTFKRYQAERIEIYLGDFFDLTKDRLGKVDLIYDRAALVALPDKMRKRYSKHMLEITDRAPQILIAFEYDHTLMNGPPFSINQLEVYQHYARAYDLGPIEIIDLPGGLKGNIDAKEVIWLMK